MIRDLRTILDGWDYEPGKISVRKIIGRDGQEKVQTRIDLGVLQIELDGRPDGARPHGCESHFDCLLRRAQQHRELHGDDEDFVISPEDCLELRHEMYLYYQRYLSLFVLEDFERVIRDTQRCLEVVDFCERFAAGDEDRHALAAQRPYVLMMNARARACLAMRERRYEAALAAVDEALAGLRQLRSEAEGDDGAGRTEIRVLTGLRAEILQNMPADAPARLYEELRAALAREDYELATRLRDQLAARGHSLAGGRPRTKPSSTTTD